MEKVRDSFIYKKNKILFMPFSKQKIEHMENIIDINCIGCPEFEKNLNNSDCLCEPMQDMFERSPVYSDEDAYSSKSAALWEYTRQRILNRLRSRKQAKKSRKK